MAKYINGSTERLEQLTGDIDPEKNLHVNFTSRWGCVGVDLGANTQHEDTTFIFFGDVIEKPGAPGPAFDMIAFIDHFTIPPGAGIATAKRSEHQLDVFFIGSNGRLYVSWVFDDEKWSGPARISAANAAPPGAAVVTAQQTGYQWDIFFVDNDGRLRVYWAVDDGDWQGPFHISKAGSAPPGAAVAAAHQGNNKLDVFFINADGRLCVYSVVGGGNWATTPYLISELHSAPPGATVTTARQGEHQLDVFFVDNKGRLRVYWVGSDDKWHGPHYISQNGSAKPGAAVTAARQGEHQLDVFFVDNQGRLRVYWVVGLTGWQGPFHISEYEQAHSGIAVTASQQGDHQLDVFFVDKDGRLRVYWVLDADGWQGPHFISQKGSAQTGTPVAAALQNNNKLAVFYTGFHNEVFTSSVVGGGNWQKPININAGFRLTPILKNKQFYPFTYQWNDKLEELPINSTPSGAFSYDGNMFVFFFHLLSEEKEPFKGFSALGVSDNPFSAIPYQLKFVISTEEKPNFFQIAPCVIRNNELPRGSLPTLDGDGVILFGHGYNKNDQSHGVHLAWMPLQKGSMPKETDLRYYNSAKKSWERNVEDSTLLFKTEDQYWTSLSVGRVPGTGDWILLYQKCGGIVLDEHDKKMPEHPSYHKPIVARIANTPWDIAFSTPLNIFDPDREHAWGRYMFHKDVFEPKIKHPGFAYGAYILQHYTQWDNESKTFTLYYLMSTGSPYQVQVMRSKISLAVIRRPWVFRLLIWIKELFER